MPTPIRVLILVDSDEPEALALAMTYANEIAKTEKVTDVVLLTHTKQQLQHTSLARHLGSAVTKTLLAGRSASLSTGVYLRHGTLSTLRYFSGKAVVIAFYADDKLMDFADGLSRLAGVVSVPWTPEASDSWRERWAPIVHGEEQQEPTDILGDPVVETALKSVSFIINLSHSVLHKRDEEWVDDTLRILRAKGHALDPSKMKNWAIGNGWKPGAASELAKRAQRIGQMKTKPRLAGVHNANDRYERWKAGET